MMKILKINISCLLLMALLSSSCSKDGSNIKAEGTVVDKTTGEPVPEAMVYLRHQRRDIATAGAMGISSIASQKADENGKFSFVFNENSNNIYVVRAVKDNYFDDSNSEASVPSNGARDLNVPMQPKAYLKVHVVNTNPVDQNDMVSISPVYGYHIEPSYGREADKIYKGIVFGNQKRAVYWWVTKNGEEKSYQDSIYCTAFDTTLYEIKY